MSDILNAGIKASADVVVDKDVIKTSGGQYGGEFADAGLLSNNAGVNSIISNVALGFKPPDNLIDNVFTNIRVPTETFRFWEFDKLLFSKIDDSIKRAVGADITLSSAEGKTLKSGVLYEYALAVRLDRREIEEARSSRLGTNIVNQRAMSCKQRVYNYLDYALVNLLTTSSNYTSTHFIDRSGSSSRWDAFDQAGDSIGDPIGDIRDGKKLVRTKIGIEPNCLLVSLDVFRVLERHPDLTGRLTIGASGSKQITLVNQVTQADVARLLGVKQIYIANQLTVGSSGAFADLLTETAILFYKSPTGAIADKESPAFLYNFIKSGRSEQAGMYDHQSGAVKVVWFTKFASPTIVMKDAGYVLRNLLQD